MALRARIPRSVVTVPPREREGESSSYLNDLRAIPWCVACGRPRTCIHHLLRSGEHGAGRRSTHKWGLPFCTSCHDAGVPGSLHHDGDEDRWMSARGLDGAALCRALWRERGNRPAMIRIVERSLLGRRRYERVG